MAGKLHVSERTSGGYGSCNFSHGVCLKLPPAFAAGVRLYFVLGDPLLEAGVLVEDDAVEADVRRSDLALPPVFQTTQRTVQDVGDVTLSPILLAVEGEMLWLFWKRSDRRLGHGGATFLSSVISRF